MPGGSLISKPTCRKCLRARAARRLFLFINLLGNIAMRWVTLKSTENVEHVINLEAVEQVVAQSGGGKQVQLRNGEKILIGAQDWTSKLHEEIQRSRGVS